jgi:copper chaperone CopZ
MKKILIALLMVCTVGAYAKTITETFLVKGECGLCKEKIEKALDIPGISFAEWSTETKMLTIRYNDKKVSATDIHTTISKLGYATDKMEADKEGQAALDSCCKPIEVKKCGTEKGCCSKEKKS